MTRNNKYSTVTVAEVRQNQLPQGIFAPTLDSRLSL